MGLFRLLVMGFLVYLIVWFLKSVTKTIEGRRDQTPGAPSSPPSPEDPDPYAVLGITHGATTQEIHAAYQTAIKQYHPDRVTGMGPELTELAEQKTKQINAAYAELKRRQPR